MDMADNIMRDRCTPAVLSPAPSSTTTASVCVDAIVEHLRGRRLLAGHVPGQIEVREIAGDVELADLHVSDPTARSVLRQPLSTDPTMIRFPDTRRWWRLGPP
jgi:hypothetical protein